MRKEQYIENRSVLLLAVIAGSLLMVIKFVAYWITNSNALLSDALESIINVSAGLFGLYALYFAHLPKDQNHPYGHGKIEFVSAAFEGGLIFVAGFGIIMKGAYHIIYPQEIKEMGTGIIMAGAAGAINYILAVLLEKKATKNHSMVLMAGSKHLISDAISSLALILGAIAVWITGWVILDNLLAAVFGGVILWTGYGLLKKSFAGILDEADYELIADLVAKLDKHRLPEWIDIHNLRVIKYGSMLHIDCHMTVPWYYTVEEAHGVLDKLEKKVHEINTQSVELFIHMDPCQEFSCAICTMQECPQRKNALVRRITWSLENAMENQKHLLSSK
jgi:cation diffusion facilitator family transporter